MSKNDATIEEGINFYKLVKIIFARWRWILLSTISVSLVILVISFLLPERFRATASLILTEPDVIFRFDPRITTEVEAPGGKGVRELALSDEVLQRILDQDIASDLEVEERVVDVFRKNLEVALSDNVLHLTVEDDDPILSAGLVNTWSEEYARFLNNLYVPSSRSQGTFEAQAAEALDNWRSAQQDLIDFQSTNPEQILNSRLSTKNESLFSFLKRERVLGFVLQDAQTILTRLLASESDQKLAFQEVLALQLLTASSLRSTQEIGPIEVQIQSHGNSPPSEEVSAQILYIEEFISSIQEEREVVIDEASKIEVDIYELQGQLATAQEERIRLEKERDLEREAFEALARKAQEEDLTSQDQGKVVRIASLATVPSEKVGPKKLLNTALGAVVGASLGIVIILLVEWWREAE